MASTSKNSAPGSQELDNNDSTSVLASAVKRIKRISIIVNPDQVPIAVEPTSPERNNVVTEMVQVDNNNIEIESPTDDSTSVLAAPRKTRIIIVKPDQVPISVKTIRSSSAVNNNIPLDPDLSQIAFENIDWKTFNLTSLVLWTNNDNGYDFAAKLGLQPITSPCKNQSCNGETRPVLRGKRRHFYCMGCKKTFSVKEGTILGKGAKLTWCQILKVIYFSCTNLETCAIMYEAGIAGSASQTEWASSIKECFELALVNTNKEPIGGPGCIVEIEKSEHVTSSKKSSEKSAAMMFGGVCRNDGKVFMFPVQNIDTETLKPIIKKWIKPGSTVVYQQWNASCSDWLENDKDYNCVSTSETNEKSQHELPEHDYLQTTNNVTGRTTSSLKRSTMASSIRTSKENIGSHLAKHLYKKKFGWFEKSIGERFRILCVHVSKIYPGVGRNAWRMIQHQEEEL